MRSKTPLALMEQLVMILVFALAAAICVRLFGLSDQISRKNEAISQAALLCQNVAEEIKSRGGVFADLFDEADEDWEFADGKWLRAYDKNWNLMSSDMDREKSGTYQLEICEEETEISGLLRVRITVTDGEDDLFAIPVAWQEVGRHE